jgi:AbrB family looped-hinge helix DNA binding protein
LIIIDETVSQRDANVITGISMIILLVRYLAQTPEIATIGEKGQVVIPQSLRKRLRLKPGTKFVVFGSGDTVVMKRLELPDMKSEWQHIFKLMDKKRLNLSENEILREVRAARKDKCVA